MKCPYCGRESREQKCEFCKALIPAETQKEEPKETRRTKKDKE